MQPSIEENTGNYLGNDEAVNKGNSWKRQQIDEQLFASSSW